MFPVCVSLISFFDHLLFSQELLCIVNMVYSLHIQRTQHKVFICVVFGVICLKINQSALFSQRIAEDLTTTWPEFQCCVCFRPTGVSVHEVELRSEGRVYAFSEPEYCHTPNGFYGSPYPGFLCLFWLRSMIRVMVFDRSWNVVHRWARIYSFGIAVFFFAEYFVGGLHGHIF